MTHPTVAPSRMPTVVRLGAAALGAAASGVLLYIVGACEELGSLVACLLGCFKLVGMSLNNAG